MRNYIHESRLLHLEDEDDELVLKTVGGETSIRFPEDSHAKPKSVRFFINGVIQVPDIHYTRVINSSGAVDAIVFDSISAELICYITWKKVRY